jgi:hypothetical protein
MVEFVRNIPVGRARSIVTWGTLAMKIGDTRCYCVHAPSTQGERIVWNNHDTILSAMAAIFFPPVMPPHRQMSVQNTAHRHVS